ncbi:MAG TPA: polysaccharide biosynthesis protein [Petrimonas sp.]|nr:polysaccharide biosynthesis protein [Petrimonas sp.]
MIIVVIINLYIVRVVIDALGVEDYGIFNVVAGVITLLSVLSNVLSTATQRFYSISIGEKNKERFSNIFSASINIYFVLSIIILIIGETIGLWFVNTQLVMPEERMVAVNYIYQFSILSFIFTILQVPYLSAIITHEDVGVYAIINICEWMLKLISAFLLYIIPFDRLIIHGAFLFIIPLFVLISYVIISRKKYQECSYKKNTDKKIYKELISFSGWTLFGSLAGVGMNQVNTILVNVFFGPIVNASRAIALQINSALNSFCSNILIPLRPPMIKAYAGKDYEYLNKIFNLSNKFIYYILLMLCVPLMFEMDIILKLWLNVVDPHAILFSRLTLIYMLIMSLNNPISIIIQATGNVKEYHTTVEIFTLLCPLATYIMFNLGYPAHTTYVLMIIAAILSHVVRLIILKKHYNPFSYKQYIIFFLVPSIIITIITSAVDYFIYLNISNDFSRLALITALTILTVIFLVLTIGLSREERNILNSLLIKNKN